jgi:hypothetical protein
MADEKNKRKIVEHSTSASSAWPYILIGIGVIWLLGNFNVFAGLWRLWPLVLVIFGVLMLSGYSQASATESHHFTTPLDGTTSARVRLHLSVGTANVRALSESDALLDADLTHRGEVEFLVSGEREKTVILRPTDRANWLWLNPANWFNNPQNLKWTVGLSDRIPLNLDIHAGVGKSIIDLTGVQVTRLDAAGGVGTVDLLLPAMATPYEIHIQGGTGDFNVDIADGAAVNLKISGGLGQFRVNTPHDAAVRLKASVGMGDVDAASRFIPVSSSSHMVGESGVWETPDFASAERQVIIQFDGGIGQLRVR